MRRFRNAWLCLRYGWTAQQPSLNLTINWSTLETTHYQWPPNHPNTFTTADHF